MVPRPLPREKSVECLLWMDASAKMLWLSPASIPPESFTLHPGEDSKTTRRMNHIARNCGRVDFEQARCGFWRKKRLD